jgi:tRNA A37 threonylcarbamoyladenosine dehydratase
MGAGGKFDPSKVKVANIFKTKHCHLSRTVKKRLKRAGFQKGIKVVFSEEQIKKDSLKMTDGSKFKKSFYGTNSYMPAIFGLYCSSEAIKICLK